MAAAAAAAARARAPAGVRGGGARPRGRVAARAGKRWAWKDGERVEREEGGDAGDLAAAGGLEAGGGGDGGASDSDNVVAFERKGKSSRKRREAKVNDTSARVGRGAVKKEAPPAEPWEEVYVQALFAFGTLILVDGTVIATSTFLPKFVDDLALNVLYPSFSYVLVVFFIMSAAFGAYKYVQGAFE